MLFGIAVPNPTEGAGHSRSERVGLARILCKSFCCGRKLCISYIELMSEIGLQRGLDLTKKRRHVPRLGLGCSMIE
jgi:hypothetical protein